MNPDVVVIGAGPVGASVAWHLAVRGVSVLVLERAAELGAGSAPRATGGFRCQFGTEINVRLSLLSREKLRRFESEVGADSGYDPAGYLFLATSAAELAALRAGLDLQHRSGLAESREVSAAEAAALNPHFSMHSIVGGAYSPTHRFIRAVRILNVYAADARRRG